jgi:ornithine--oxo-acid transaminase
VACDLGEDAMAFEQRHQDELAEQAPARLLHQGIGRLQVEAPGRAELDRDRHALAAVGAVAMKRSIFDQVFDRMERAVVHGSTFSKNDLAMAAGLATLAVLDEEKLIERADRQGRRLIVGLRARLGAHQFVRAVRGKGMMIAIEFGPPRSLRLKAAYALMEQASRGLFCQLVLMPLFERHRILAQVAGHGMPVIKLLPPLVVGDDDLAWIENAFDTVIRESENLGAVWQRGKNLARHAVSA